MFYKLKCYFYSNLSEIDIDEEVTPKGNCKEEDNLDSNSEDLDRLGFG